MLKHDQSEELAGMMRCFVCPAVFRSRSEFAKHLQTMHSGTMNDQQMALYTKFVTTHPMSDEVNTSQMPSGKTSRPDWYRFFYLITRVWEVEGSPLQIAWDRPIELPRVCPMIPCSYIHVSELSVAAHLYEYVWVVSSPLDFNQLAFWYYHITKLGINYEFVVFYCI